LRCPIYGGVKGGRAGHAPIVMVPSKHCRWVTILPGVVVVSVAATAVVSVTVTVVGAVMVIVVGTVVVMVAVTTDGGAAGSWRSATVKAPSAEWSSRCDEMASM